MSGTSLKGFLRCQLLWHDVDECDVGSDMYGTLLVLLMMTTKRLLQIIEDPITYDIYNGFLVE